MIQNYMREPPYHLYLPSVQIICKGNLMFSGLIKKKPKRRRNKKSVQRTTVNEFKLIFNISQEMVPSCRILVYYVRQNKEVVGDSIVYDVEDKLQKPGNYKKLKLLKLIFVAFSSVKSN